METSVVVAIITAGVSLVVSMLAFVSALRGRESERERQERELQRKLTERLYELRIANYPKAFSITQPLQGELLFTEGITKEDCIKLVEELNSWACKDSAFSMSRPSLRAFYRLRDELRDSAKPEIVIDRARLNRLLEAKTAFRASLTEDVALLFSEDRKKPNKAPEPTPTSVTPPANEGKTK